jgi:mannose/fructose/N-acetylgalactosamine-specific phosphotransferase system component IIC
MAIENIVTSQLPMIPVYFYMYSFLASAAVAFISFLISYFSFKIYRKSSIKLNLVLSLGFLALGIAFTSLTLASLYTHNYNPLEDYENLTKVNNAAYNSYYILSLISYILFVMMYLPGKMKNKFFVVYLPLWYVDSLSFHTLSIFLVGYVLLANLINCLKKRSLNSFLVTLAFLGLEVFHILLLLTSFDVSMYLAAYTLLTIGFSSLLIMLIRVGVK